VASQSTDYCHYSSYESVVYKLVFENDLKSLKELDIGCSLILKREGDLEISPLEYAILLNRNEIMQHLFYKVKAKFKRNKKLADFYIRVSILSGNSFSLDKIIDCCSKKIELEKYNKDLISFIGSYDYAKNAQGEKSFCYSAIPNSADKKIINRYLNFYLEDEDYQKATNLINILIVECARFLQLNYDCISIDKFTEINSHNLDEIKKCFISLVDSDL